MSDRIYSIGDLARRYGVTIYPVVRAIRDRGIEEAGRIGANRFFDEAAAERVGEALKETASRKSGAKRGER